MSRLFHYFQPRSLLLFILASLFAVCLAYQFNPARNIDVGSGRDTPFIQGFSFRENSNPSGNFRWSGARAEIRFWGLGSQDGTLGLDLAAPRPSAPARVQLFANGQSLGAIQPGAGFQEFHFPISRSMIGPGGDLVVTLTSDTFTQPPDERELGLQVDSARVDSAGAPVLPSPRALYLVALALLALFILRAWTGSAPFALALAALTILLEFAGLIFARVEAVWFAAPLFWFLLCAGLGAFLFAHILQRLNPALSPRTLRLLFAALVLAFAVRMVLAVGPGFIVDTQDYVVWSYKTVVYGLGSAYASINGLWIADQSPGLVYLLHLMGMIYHAVFSPDFLYPGVAGDPALRGLSTNPAFLADPVQRTLLRMPSLLGDLLTGALIFAAARKSLSERVSWLVAFGYWLNPAVLWNGAYWGQTDAIYAVLVLAAFLLMESKRVGWAFFILGIAALTKPQAAIYGPLLLLWALREHNWRGVVRAALAGAAGAVLVLLPMFLVGGVGGMLAYFADTVGHHPILSANAHNLWWMLKNGQIDVEDTRRIIPTFPLSYRTFSLMLFGLFYLAALARAWFAPRAQFFAIGAFVAFAFFMLPTEIHENYGYGLLPLLALALTRDRNWLWFYVAVTVTMVGNYALSDPPVFSWLGLSDPVNQLALARQLNALANTLLFAAWTLYVLVSPRLLFPRPVALEPQRR